MMMFPDLTTAITSAASYNGRHTEPTTIRSGCPLCAAHRQGVHACADELLPAVLGGEWLHTKGAWPPVGQVQDRTVFDHWHSFRRRGVRGPCSWRDGAIVSQPYDHIFCDGEFYPEFVKAAQALAARHQIGVWVSSELSFYYPGSSVLVLLARGLVPERAAQFGFVSAPLTSS